VVDLGDAHLKALDVLDSSEKGFVCNLGTGRGSSVLEVIAAFEKANDIEIPFEFASRRAGDVTEAWADPAFAKQFLGWKTKYGLEEMLADAWRWQSQNPNGYR
jgi:UDP-glucose 4-epimerase